MNETEENVTCEFCSKVVDKDASYTHDNDLHCEDCYHERYMMCESCESIASVENVHNVDDKVICDSCYDNDYFTCSNCNTVDVNDNAHTAYNEIYCERCFSESYFYCEGCDIFVSHDAASEDENGYIVCESCAEPKISFVDSPTFKVNKSKRFVGIEVEYIGRDSIDFSELGYRKSDGSVSATDGDGDGWEFASQPMNGDKLLNNIDELCTRFKESNAYVNNSCGFHVHLDMRDSTRQEQANVFRFWKLYQQLFFDVCSRSRHSSSYCKAIPESVDFDHATMRLDRYSALNVHAMSKYGTFEIRLHQGTIDPIKIKNWCLLLVNFFDVFSKINCTDEKYKEISEMSKRKKLIYLFQSIKIPLSLKKYIVKRILRFKHKGYEGYFYREPVQLLLKLNYPEKLDIDHVFKRALSDNIYCQEYIRNLIVAVDDEQLSSYVHITNGD